MSSTSGPVCSASFFVSQGWLVAGNVFNAREAKRLYPLLGMSMVLGAASGGEFTNRVVRLVGTRNLLLACAAIVVVAYGAFRVAVSHSATSVEHAHAGSEEETDFSFLGLSGTSRASATCKSLSA